MLSGTGATKKAAKANALAKAARPSPPSTTSTLAEAWKALEPELCRDLAPTNFAAHCSTFAKLSIGGLAGKEVSQITAETITQWASLLGVSLLTRRGHVARVRSVLKRMGYTVIVSLPKPPKKEKPTVYGRDAEEFMEFVRSLPPNRRLAVGLIYFSGLRRSEACGLRYEDIRGTGAYLSVSVTETDEAVHVRKRLKTDASAAYVSLGAELLGWIGKGSGFVLSGTDTPMKPRALTQLVRRAVAGTKWAKLRPQALRRAHGQLIVERTGNLKLVAGALRHSVAMAAEEYTSVDPTLKDATHGTVFGPLRAKTGSKKKAE